jgi:V8-like Glu-specific endopeptidase
MNHSDSQLVQFGDALAAVCLTRDRFAMFVAATETGIDLDAEFGNGHGLKSLAFQFLRLVQATHGGERVDAVLDLAHRRAPGNEKLKAFAQSILLGQVGATSATLRKLRIEDSGGYQARFAKFRGLLPTHEWRRQMLARESPVCQILRHGEPVGTGFLVGPNLVMSNWHVFESERGSGVLAGIGEFAARFDYRAEAGKPGALPVTTIAFDGASKFEDASRADELDYALVSIPGRIGEDPAPGQARRGWLNLGRRDFEVGDAVVVLQHPDGRPLEFGAGIVLGWQSGHPHRIYEHRADTEEGSSGSPCFAADWTMLAIHHRVDPKTGQCNRAIASTAILQCMAHRNTIGLLPPLG